MAYRWPERCATLFGKSLAMEKRMPTLLYSPTSPYARKVRVLIRECGLAKQIDEQTALPLDDPEALLAANPLGKVPALLLDDGSVLYDSRVICAWVAAQVAGHGDSGDAAHYWQAQRRAALAEGVIDASVALVMEGRRPSAQQSDYWIGRWRNAIARSLDVLDGEVDALHDQIDAITSAAALGHLDLRHGDLNWRDRRPALAVWFDAFSQRPSMQATVPG
ncbi:MAG: glutathione S-transferase [Gammaproteobacteria bacterium HGW-Gammaproteobacteria-2]|jgi:glutathione S-transferase|nr:MAG: glutathione S-transferase [Gammaproteobacteria bacterium HGW-Gammaproteobacteria-2]